MTLGEAIRADVRSVHRGAGQGQTDRRRRRDSDDDRAQATSGHASPRRHVVPSAATEPSLSTGYAHGVLGERTAVVAEVQPYEVHGSRHVKVALAFPDGTFAQAQLGAESVPEGLEPGDPVVVRFAMSVVIAVERPPA